MADKVIDIPGVGSVAFPDSMNEAQINAAATKLYQQSNPGKKQPPVKSWMDTAVDWLPAIGGAIGGIAGNIPGAALGAAGGEAYKQLIHRAQGQDAPATPLEAAKGIATQAVVQGAAPELAGGLVGKAMSAAAPRIMQSAVKPTLATLRDVAKGAPVPRVVQTLLDEGVNVSPAGLQKLQALLGHQRADIAKDVAGATASGATISPFRVASRLGDTAKKFAQQVNPTADLEAVTKAGNEFLQTTGGQSLTPTTAQALKQGTYAQIGKKYGQLGSADVEAQKALARGLKEELEKAIPGIDAKNLSEAQLMEAAKAVGRRVAVASNRDPVGFAWVTQHPTIFLSALIDRSPAAKSMIARGLYQTAGAMGKVSPDLIRAAVASLAGADSGVAPGPE